MKFVEKLVFYCLKISQLRFESQSGILLKINLVGKGSYMDNLFT